MKKIILSLYFLTLSLTAAAAQKEVCFGHDEVSATTPYILTLKNVNPHQLHLLSEDLLTDQVIRVEDRIDFTSGTLSVWVLSVDKHKIMTTNGKITNRQVDQYVRNYVSFLMKKYKLSNKKVFIDCNYLNYTQPRAGGVN